MIVDSKYPELSGLLAAQLRTTPAQEKFFIKRFQSTEEDELSFLEDVAINVGKLIDGRTDQYCEDYSWLCEQQLAEELHFRRYGRYRLSSFEEALKEVYSNKPYMTRYMNGLLMTQLWWSNHTKVLHFYETHFLNANPDGFTHLEIGPGHGLFLYLAARHPKHGKIVAWDISEASIEATRSGLLKLGLKQPPSLELVDMFQDPAGSFQSVVFSEVLEHMERPREALEVIRSVMAPDGRLFLNMPINSPAPDHLFNADTPEDLEVFVCDAGFEIEDRALFPATNQSLEDSRKKRLTISCAFIARPS